MGKLGKEGVKHDSFSFYIKMTHESYKIEISLLSTEITEFDKHNPK